MAGHSAKTGDKLGWKDQIYIVKVAEEVSNLAIIELFNNYSYTVFIKRWKVECQLVFVEKSNVQWSGTIRRVRK